MVGDDEAIRAGLGPARPLERAWTIPASWYLDPAIADRERGQVFGDSWLVAGRAEQVEAPGSFLTIDVAGEPILVVRGDDGVLRAFSNVCRHRAARVVGEAEGCASRLRCRYHGWTYDLAGRLRGVPEFDGVEAFRREENGLPGLAVATSGPWVWVRGAEDADRSLADDLAPMPEKLAGLDLKSLRWAGRREYDVACNWKVYVDNYLDGGYHVNTVHPALAGVVDYARYRTEFSGRTAVQISPLRAPDARDDASAATVRGGVCAYYWWAFPNFMANIYDGLMDTNIVLPLEPGRCRVLFDFYFAPDHDAAFIDQSIAVADQVQLEDMTICEDVQRGLSSRSYLAGRFSARREGAGHHFHRLLSQSLKVS